MAKPPATGTSTQKETDEYFAARNRELTRRAMERYKDSSAEPPMKIRPVEYVELFNSDSIEKDYGPYKMSYESGRGFRKKCAGSSSWDSASADEVRAFKNDIRSAAGKNPKIARYIANEPEFK